MKYRRIITTFLALVLLLSVSTIGIFANSAQRQWEGVDSTGAIAADQNCPIVVEEELLTFDISEFPKGYYDEETEYLSYSGTVTAQYAFYNPAEYTVTADLVFPFGNTPSYGFNIYDEKLGRRVHADDTAKFDIKADGQVIEKNLRHTLFTPYSQFRLSEDMVRLYDGFVEDTFYSPELSVIRYTYTISGVDKELYPAATMAFDVSNFDGTRKVLWPEQSGNHTNGNGDVRISGWADNNGAIVSLYVIGEPFAEDPEWKFYKDGGVEDGEEIEGTLTLEKTEELSFKELVFMEYDPAGGISETDWYNAMVEAFNRNSLETSVILFHMEHYGFDISDMLMRWYEYELTFEPGQRLVNTVEAPVYPSINNNYEPSIFGYTYFLSPAKTWAEFGKLDIVINTPFFMTESNLPGFSKTEAGYSLSVEGLPEKELSFTLSPSETPGRSSNSNYIFVLFIIILLIVVAILIAVIVVAVKLVRRRKK